MNKDAVNQSAEKLGYSDLIALLDHYREDKQYRDSEFLSIFFRFFSLSFIITFFPSLVERIGVNADSPLLIAIPIWLYPIFGIICALFGFIVSWTEEKRIITNNEIYFSLINKLPAEYRIDILKHKKHRNKVVRFFSTIHLNILLCFLYAIPIVFSVLDIVFIFSR